jgi:hypothetical protein
MLSKLVEFLDMFETMYNEWLHNNESTTHEKLSLDKIYGDCTEFLLDLLHVLDRQVNVEKTNHDLTMVAELVNKALAVAELILKACIHAAYMTLVRRKSTARSWPKHQN